MERRLEFLDVLLAAFIGKFIREKFARFSAHIWQSKLYTTFSIKNFKSFLYFSKNQKSYEDT